MIGGHSSLGETTQIGLVINGIAQVKANQNERHLNNNALDNNTLNNTLKNNAINKNTLNPGDSLILTKALGTGLIFAGQPLGLSKGPWIDQAIEQMLIPNAQAAQLAEQHGASACTDITGFGLGGHLLEMLNQTDLCVQLNPDALPLLDGASTLIEQGVRSSLYPQNLRRIEQDCQSTVPAILADPQTSGGLLIAIEAHKAQGLLDALHYGSEPNSAIIGEVSTIESNALNVSKLQFDA